MPDSNQPKYEAVFFDLDGTLVDTAPEAAEALNRTLSRHGVPKVQPDDVRSWFGRGMMALLGEALDALAGGCTLPPLPELQQEFSDHYRDLSGQMSTPYPAVAETLTALRNGGVKCVLITNKEKLCALRVIDSHGLTELFDVHIYGDTYATRKPDPGGVTLNLAHWGIAPQNALLVGDSEIDAATGRNAGTQVWLASYGYMRGGSVYDADADRVIDSLDELRELLPG